MIPLILRLKRAEHKEIARAQDLILESVYDIFDNAVLHGGTSIWRCYKGNRFSEDLDFYLSKDFKKISKLFDLLEKKGFKIKKKKISEKTIYSKLEFNRTIVRFEAIFKNINSSLKEYETAEGNIITINSLNAEELIIEKVRAYLNRFKVRDLYDLFFLLRYVNNISLVKKSLLELISKFKKPSDEKELKVLIFEGISPNIDEMLSYIKNKL